LYVHKVNLPKNNYFSLIENAKDIENHYG